MITSSSGTCSWPTDGELQWRWVQENGKKHPQVPQWTNSIGQAVDASTSSKPVDTKD